MKFTLKVARNNLRRHRIQWVILLRLIIMKMLSNLLDDAKSKFSQNIKTDGEISFTVLLFQHVR